MSLTPPQTVPGLDIRAIEGFQTIRTHVNRQIIGQVEMVDRLLIALLADGHLLVEGAPGLAKTKAVKEIARCVEGDFHRVQFTPDLLPADLTGTEVYRPDDGSFVFQPGPLFHNIILADEVNRAPAKVQSALLEAMGERQITVGKTTYNLPRLFMVMATQNPIEQEGTYPLPEAQLDRFLMHIRVDYPAGNSEREILQLVREETLKQIDDIPDTMEPLISQELVFSAREQLLRLHMAAPLEEYLVQLVLATRQPEVYETDFKRWVNFGASPRATIALDRCARAHAWLNRRDYVSPDDIQAVAHDVFRHRILMSFEAEAEGIDADRFVSELIKRVAVP